ncbi:hypothetical protein [Streptacidiphilus anmyonensis]|uniref:hypothetical protein n=1 Tax=Streptacidiphilus anmyonensis TaxID=405782 RepID=UPI0005A95EC2|nr:hypothetical protein [Streptacidiphilus anmyonensis]
MSDHDRPRPEHYNFDESMRGLGLMLRASVRVVRRKPVGKLERQLDRLAEEAIAREAKAKAEKQK